MFYNLLNIHTKNIGLSLPLNKRLKHFHRSILIFSKYELNYKRVVNKFNFIKTNLLQNVYHLLAIQSEWWSMCYHVCYCLDMGWFSRSHGSCWPLPGVVPCFVHMLYSSYSRWVCHFSCGANVVICWRPMFQYNLHGLYIISCTITCCLFTSIASLSTNKLF